MASLILLQNPQSILSSLTTVDNIEWTTFTRSFIHSWRRHTSSVDPHGPTLNELPLATVLKAGELISTMSPLLTGGDTDEMCAWGNKVKYGLAM